MDLTKYAGKEVVLTLKGRGTAPAGTKDALIFTNAWSTKDTATVKVAGTDLNVFESANWSDEFTVTLTVPESGILWLTAGNWGSNDAFDAYVQLISVVDPNAPVATDVFAGTTWADAYEYHTVTFANGKVTITGMGDECIDNLALDYTVEGNTATITYEGWFGPSTMTFVIGEDGSAMLYDKYGEAMTSHGSYIKKA
jgi:hypothetical protein